MAIGTRICKVCGKEYPYCKTERRLGIFRWQDVACSPEHGAIYFAEVEAARAHTPIADAHTIKESEEAITAGADDTDEKVRKPAAKASRKKQS